MTENERTRTDSKLDSITQLQKNPIVLTYPGDSARSRSCSVSRNRLGPWLPRLRFYSLKNEQRMSEQAQIVSLIPSHSCKEWSHSSNILRRLSSVKVMLCIKDSARALAPSFPMQFPKK